MATPDVADRRWALVGARDEGDGRASLCRAVVPVANSLLERLGCEARRFVRVHVPLAIMVRPCEVS